SSCSSTSAKSCPDETWNSTRPSPIAIRTRTGSSPNRRPESSPITGDREQGCSRNPQAGMPALRPIGLRSAGIPACGFWRHPYRQFRKTPRPLRFTPARSTLERVSTSQSTTGDATTPSTSEPARRSAFVTTQWTVVLTAARSDTPRAHAALENLCRSYWPPLYAYVRRRGNSPADAEDLTQEFFARLLER